MTETQNQDSGHAPAPSNNSHVAALSSQTTLALNAAIDHITAGYVATKKFVMEKIGKPKPERDPALKPHVRTLELCKEDYDLLVRVGKSYLTQFTYMTEDLRQMGQCLAQIGVREKDMLEMKQAGDSLVQLCKHRDAFLPHAKRFFESAATFNEKAIDDTYLTLEKLDQLSKQCDQAQIELQKLTEASKRQEEKIAQVTEKLQKLLSTRTQMQNDVIVKIQMLSMKRDQDLKMHVNTFMHYLAGMHQENAQAMSLYLSMQSPRDISQPHFLPPVLLASTHNNNLSGNHAPNHTPAHTTTATTAVHSAPADLLADLAPASSPSFSSSSFSSSPAMGTPANSGPETDLLA